MRALGLVWLLLGVSLTLGCRDSEPAAKAPAKLGGSKADCREVCEKSPRLHFEHRLQMRLVRVEKSAQAKEREKAEAEWRSHGEHTRRQIEGCVDHCTAHAMPEEIACLKKAATFLAVRTCFKRYRKGRAPRRPSGAPPGKKPAQAPPSKG